MMSIYLWFLLVSLSPCLSLPLAKGHDVHQIANINPQTIDYEIDKVKLIKFPDEQMDDPALRNTRYNDYDYDTQRILREIEKINQSLGYIKRSQTTRTPIILDSNQYLFPQTATNFKSMEEQQMNPRVLHTDQRYALMNTVPSLRSLMVSDNQPIAIREKLPILKAIDLDCSPQNPTTNDFNYSPLKALAQRDNFVNDMETNQQLAELTDRNQQVERQSRQHLFYVIPKTHHLTLVVEPNKSHKLIKSLKANATNATKMPASIESTSSRISSKFQSRNFTDSLNSLNTTTTTDTTSESRAVPYKKIQIVPNNATSTKTAIHSQQQYLLNTTANSAAVLNNSNVGILKGAFQNIFKFPFRQDDKPPIGQQSAITSTTTTTTTEATSIFPSVPLLLPQRFPLKPILPPSSLPTFHLPFTMVTNYEEANGGSSSADGGNTIDETTINGEDLEEKILGHHIHKNQQVQTEAIKHGGIIIQKLKVRKGGIAIAGPGGVATAGSGGTAIVGPGGYALTHPRSLTIAGPGAKIFAIPAHVDLRDALQRTNLKELTLPGEGRLVAIGPTIYYAPPIEEL